MSRVGKQPLKVPKGVQVKIDGNTLSVKGPKGELKRTMHDSVVMKLDGETLTFTQKVADMDTRKYWGLTRNLAANMIEGVANGYSRGLTLVGVGYRAQQKGPGFSMTVGLAHPVEFMPPKGITITVDKLTSIIVSGPDKVLVGDVAAKIRGYRPPEPYHGKGVRYATEVVKTKVGKATAGATTK
jgi:large subunit ribosomal protein L6